MDLGVHAPARVAQFDQMSQNRFNVVLVVVKMWRDAQAAVAPPYVNAAPRQFSHEFVWAGPYSEETIEARDCHSVDVSGLTPGRQKSVYEFGCQSFVMRRNLSTPIDSRNSRALFNT